MENHPIPQDITGFQFKLIGNMTIKQFAYLATGSIIAWIFFSLPISVFIKLPFSFLFALLGIAFAFLPIEGRPMDIMILNFSKALFNPTQYVFEKVGGSLYIQTHPPEAKQPVSQTSDEKQNLAAYLSTLQKPINKLDEREMGFFKSLALLFAPAPLKTPVANQPSTGAYIISAEFDDEKKKTEPVKETRSPDESALVPEVSELEKEELSLSQKLEKTKLAFDMAKEEEAQQLIKGREELYQSAHQKVLEIEKLLNETLLQKQTLESELLRLKRELDEKNKEAFTPGILTYQKKESQNVRSIPQNMGKSVGIPIAPEFPNMITGIIKDPRGNSLPNILVEVKDKTGNPVRAFKTNALGQFQASTPLSNGTYRIEFEDPKSQNKFDIIEFIASGQIILPIEVISEDTREELRKSLFN